MLQSLFIPFSFLIRKDEPQFGDNLLGRRRLGRQPGVDAAPHAGRKRTEGLLCFAVAAGEGGEKCRLQHLQHARAGTSCLAWAWIVFFFCVWQVQSIRTDQDLDFLSDSLARFSAALIDALPNGPSEDLFRSFRPCASCEEFRRYGKQNDGGYLMCMDHLQNESAAYSVGAEHHDKWSLQVQEALTVPVFQFDCTVEGPAQLCDACKFIKR